MPAAHEAETATNGHACRLGLCHQCEPDNSACAGDLALSKSATLQFFRKKKISNTSEFWCKKEQNTQHMLSYLPRVVLFTKTRVSHVLYKLIFCFCVLPLSVQDIFQYLPVSIQISKTLCTWASSHLLLKENPCGEVPERRANSLKRTLL